MGAESLIKRDLGIGLKSLFGTFACLAAVVVLAAVLLPAVSSRGIPFKIAQAKSCEMQLVGALRNYRTEYGSFPEGDYPAIIRTLVGDNSRRIVYLAFRDKEAGSHGEWLDPWGTPYRVDLSDPVNPRVSSAGKNKKFEPGSTDSDDVRSWKERGSMKGF